MQNFNTASQGSSFSSQGVPRGQQDFQKLFHRLRDLHEVQDESRNELCPVFLDEQSLIKTRRESNWSAQQVPTQVNILKQLQQTSQLLHRDDPTGTISATRSSYNLLSDQDLRESNRKLHQDNVKLYNECIRLRKLHQAWQTKGQNFNKKSLKESSLALESRREEENRVLRLEVEELKAQNSSLNEQIKSMQLQVASQRTLAERYEQACSQLQSIRLTNEELVTKVLTLERQLEAAATRAASKSSQSISINNSTQQSRKTQIEKQRMITNMKIVHESQKLKLKGIIEQLKKQLERCGKTSSFSNLVTARKK